MNSKDWTPKAAKTKCTHYHLKSTTQNSINHLKNGKYQQTPYEIIKVQGARLMWKPIGVRAASMMNLLLCFPSTT